MVIGLDIGYGYTKMAYLGATGKRSLVIPSTVSRYIPEKSFGDSFEVIRVNGRPFIVGSDIAGSSRVGSNFVGTEEYFAIIGHCLSRADAAKRILVLGLPPQAYQKDRMQTLKDAIRGMDVCLEDGARLYIPQRVEFVPQGAGIFMAHLRNNGAAQGDMGKTTIIVDIGYHTMDTVLFAKGRYRNDVSRSYPLGVKYLYDKVRDAYIRKYASFLSHDVDGIAEALLRNGRIMHFGETHTLDTGAILDDYYMGRVVHAILDYNASVKESGFVVENIIFGGGGVQYLKGMPGAHVVDEPQVANAEGFMEYGLTLLTAKARGFSDNK